MKKVVVAIVAVVAVLLLALPPVLGRLTESRVRERVAAINTSGIATAEVKSFDSGWFASKARIEFGFSPGYLAQLGAQGAPVNVIGQHATIVIDFAHGPVTLKDGVHLELSTMAAQLDPETPGLAGLEKQLGVPYVFEFRSRTGLGGRVVFDADVPPVDVPAGDAQFKFSGAKLEGTYTNKQVVSNTHVDSIEFSGPGGAFVLRNLRLNTDNQMLAPDVAPGSMEFSIESASAIDPLQGSAPIFEANKLKVTALTTLNAARTLFDVQVTYGVDRVHVEENEVTNAILGFSVHNVDAELIKHYGVAMRELMAGGAQPDPRAALASLRPDLPRALAAGPSLVLEPIRFAFNGEPFDGRWEFTIDPAKVPPDALTNLDPAAVLGFVNSNADVKLSKGLARAIVALVVEMQLRGDPRMPPEQMKYMAEAQAGLMLVTLVTQGFLVEDGEVYRAALRYVDGALTLNDKPLPLGLQ